MKQILFTMLALLLAATSLGIAARQAESTGALPDFGVVVEAADGLRKTQDNNFSQLCKDAGFNRDTILKDLHIMPSLINRLEADQWEKHSQMAGYFNSLIAVCREINESKTYNDAACRKFLTAYASGRISAIDLEKLLEAQKEQAGQDEPRTQEGEAFSEPEKQEAHSGVTRDTLQELAALTSSYKTLESEIIRLSRILWGVGMLAGMSFICLIVLLRRSKHQRESYPQTKDEEDERISEKYATQISVNRLDGRVHTLEQDNGVLKHTTSQLTHSVEDIQKNLSSRLGREGFTGVPEGGGEPPVTPPVISSPPYGLPVQSSPQPRPEVIYVIVNAEKPKALCKQSLVRSYEHLYEIHPESSPASSGEVHICQDIRPEFARKFIDQRMQYLQICEVVSATGNPQRIVMISPGKAFKNGNEWIVTTPPKVQLV